MASPISRHCMSRELWQEEDWPNEPFGKFLDRCMDYQKNLQSFKKCKSSWGIVERCLEKYELDEESILNNDQTTWGNLQLFKSTNEESPDSRLVHHINRTKLSLGSRILESWIAHPVPRKKIDIVKNRQQAVYSLLNHPELFLAVDEQLSKIQSSENFILSFWLNDPLYNTSSKNYFSYLGETVNEKLNSFPAILNMSSLWSHSQRGIQWASALFGLGSLAQYSILTNPLQESSAASYLGAASPLFSITRNYFSEKIDLGSYLWKPFYAVAAILTAKVAKESYDWMRDNISLQMYNQEKLIHLNTFIEAMNKINELLSKSPFPAHSYLTNAVQELSKKENPISALIEILSRNTFKDTPHFWSSAGDILVASKMIHEHKEFLEEALYALGEIDAYMSIARLYKESQDRPVIYSFASFIDDSKTPVIFARDLWNPFIDPNRAVPNTIELGTENAKRNMILTGPNEGGKSTFIKGMAISIILSQSLGILPAKEARLTPFDYVATYLNVTDDDGKSLFEAQAQRAKYILDQIENLDTEALAFVVLDEMFNGTNATVGQSLAYTYATYLGKFQNVMAIFPTHFPFMTSLEEEESYSNYCLGAKATLDGSILYSYKIVPGIWERNIALDILRHEGFPESFLNDVHRLLE